jgi:hypothetical protein
VEGGMLKSAWRGRVGLQSGNWGLLGLNDR